MPRAKKIKEVKHEVSSEVVSAIPETSVSYEWAVNTIKLNRAVNHLRVAKAEINDESVKAEYLKLGGLIR